MSVQVQDSAGSSVTFEVWHEGYFLFIRRPLSDGTLGGYWGFPGGRLDLKHDEMSAKLRSETLVEAAVRECAEEVGVELTGRGFFVDTYPLGRRAGAHFVLEGKSSSVKPIEFDEFAWLNSVEELDRLKPLIPGIKNHVVYSQQRFRSAAAILERLNSSGRHTDNQTMVDDLLWTNLDIMNLIPLRYLNG